MDTSIAHSIAEAAAHAPANRLEVVKPVECALAMDMLASGESYAEIARETGLTHYAIAALRGRHEEAIAVRRARAADEAEHLADVYRQVLREKAEGLLSDKEALKKLNPKDAALTLGILTDKAMTLRGEATSVVEHRKGVSLEDAAAMIEAARKKVRGEAIDV